MVVRENDFQLFINQFGHGNIIVDKTVLVLCPQINFHIMATIGQVKIRNIESFLMVNHFSDLIHEVHGTLKTVKGKESNQYRNLIMRVVIMMVVFVPGFQADLPKRQTCFDLFMLVHDLSE